MSQRIARTELAEAVGFDQKALRSHPEVVEQALDGSVTDYLGAKAVSFVSSPPLEDLRCRQTSSKNSLTRQRYT